jgi:hypothetical protein
MFCVEGKTEGRKPETSTKNVVQEFQLRSFVHISQLKILEKSTVSSRRCLLVSIG